MADGLFHPDDVPAEVVPGELPLWTGGYASYKPLGVKEVEEFEGSAVTLWTRDGGGGLYEQRPERKRTSSEEKLDQYRMKVFEEKLEYAGDDKKHDKWSNPFLDRSVKPHPPRSRPKTNVAEDPKVGTTIDLGDFEGLEAFTVSEASQMMNAIFEDRVKKGKRIIYADSKQYHHVDEAKSYANHLSIYTSRETVEAVDVLLRGYPKLHAFERAQLGTFGVDTGDEILALVPSLEEKKDKLLGGDAGLQDLLDQLGRLRDREVTGTKAWLENDWEE